MLPYITGGLAGSTQRAWASLLCTSCIGQRRLHGELLCAYRAAREVGQQTTASGLLLLSAPEGDHGAWDSPSVSWLLPPWTGLSLLKMPSDFSLGCCEWEESTVDRVMVASTLQFIEIFPSISFPLRTRQAGCRVLKECAWVWWWFWREPCLWGRLGPRWSRDVVGPWPTLPKRLRSVFWITEVGVKVLSVIRMVRQSRPPSTAYR